MKYISLDLETTGLKVKEFSRIIGLSMVIEDTENIQDVYELPHLTFLVNQGEFVGEPYALSMSENSKFLRMIATNDRSLCDILSPDEAKARIKHFVKFHFPDRKPIVAGQNVGTFDLRFLSELEDLFCFRTIECGSVFIDWKRGGPQSLLNVKKKLGVEGEVTHNMYDDALDVIRCLRKNYQ